MIRENWGASVGYACAQDGGNVREMVRRMVIYANLFADRSMGYERSIQRKVTREISFNDGVTGSRLISMRLQM